MDEVRVISPNSGGQNEVLSEKEKIRRRINEEHDMSKIRVVPAKQERKMTDRTFKKRVVIYCRVSTDGLAQVTSFELQKKYYLKMAKQRSDWELVAMYSDEGISATGTKKRIGLLRMLDDARAGKFDMIVVKNLSRLSRNLMDCMNIIYELRQLPRPVGILFENENLFTLDKTADFTLQVLSLVAQEESHKKSEAMLGSVRARFSQGQFLVQDTMGYRKTDVNKIEVDTEEAKTLNHMVAQFLSRPHISTLVDELISLGRKTHCRYLRDGRTKGGDLNWTRGKVLSALTNEHCCGYVHAQKTVTIDYLTHKSIKNNGEEVSYWAEDQHEAIISKERYDLVQRILAATRGRWEYDSIPSMDVFDSGVLQGFTSVVPTWLGFTANDYNRAALSAYGVAEDELEAIADRIALQEQDGFGGDAADDGYAHQYDITSNDQEMFLDDEDIVIEDETVPHESFFDWIQQCRKKKDSVSIDKTVEGIYDLTDCEVIRPQLFSMREKAYFTIDYKGITFNKFAFTLLSDFGQVEVENIEMFYNPVEEIIVVRPANTVSEKTMGWIRVTDDTVFMRRCDCRGVTGTIYENMGWNPNFNYRVIGSATEIDGQTMLVFYLDDPIQIVKVKEQKIDPTKKLSAKETREIVRDGYVASEKSYIPNLDDFDIGHGPMAEGAKNMTRSRAIYYDEIVKNADGKIQLEDLGDKKYDPEFIRQMIQKGLAPENGWQYLKGRAVFTESGFRFFPETWQHSFGATVYETQAYKMKSLFGGRTGSGESKPYGWTVGLNIPTQEEVQKSAESLRAQITA